MFSHLKKYAVILPMLLTLSGCASTPPSSKHFTQGTIPKATVPSPNNISNTRKAIVKELGYKQGFRLTDRGPEHARVDRIVRRLSQASGLGGFSYPVVIADAGKQANAMAVNGNTIVVYKTLLKRVPDDNELAAVLAHEVSHITNRHHADNVLQQREALVSIGSSLLGSVIGSNIDQEAGQLAQNIAGTIGKGAYVNAYSREMEFEADHTGVLLMAKAGYNPQAALSFWGRANQIFGTAGGGADFLSTHPSEGRRLERIQQSMPLAMQYYHR